ncbi:unnamed protein product, partial [Musa acuminata var. zebrina]
MAQGRGSAAAGGQAAVALGLVVLCLLLAHVQVAEAATYTVGDSGGWSFNIASWSRGKRFRAGDVLGECWPASCWASVFCRLILFFVCCSLQVQPVGAQRGGGERRRLQRLLDSPGLQGVHLRQRPHHARQGEELLHLQLHRPLPVRDEDSDRRR